MSNIPSGTQDDPRAPWNQEDEEYKTIPIEVTIILKSKFWISGYDSQLIDDDFVQRRAENFIQCSLTCGFDNQFEITEIERLK